MKKDLPQNETNSVGNKLTAYFWILITGIVAYSASFDGVFVFDGIGEVLQNDNVHTLASPWKTMFEARSLPARPIPYLTFAINHVIHGESVWGYHFLSLAIHLGCALLIFGILNRTLLLPSMRERYEQHAWSLSLIVAVLWSIHPLQSQGVMYLYQRIEILMAFFFLASLYCFIRARTTPMKFPVWEVLCVASCSLGMLSKEVMVTAPLVIFWYDRVFIAASWDNMKSKKSLIYLPLMASWLILYALIQSQSKKWDGIFIENEPSGLHYLFTQAEVIPYYIRLLLIPHPLCFEYEWPIQESFTAVILPGLFVVAMVVATFWAMIKRPGIGFLAGCFFLILAPTSTIKPIFQPANEHRLYLPAVAFVALVVFCVFELLEKYKKKLPVMKAKKLSKTVLIVLCSVIVVFVFTTRERTKVYSSMISLWKDTVEKAPQNAIARQQLGAGYEMSEDYKTAAEHFRVKTELEPDDYLGWKSLGGMENLLGNHEVAEKHLRRALSIVPDSMEVYMLLAESFEERDMKKEAIAAYKKAMEIEPERAMLHRLYAIALMKDEQFEEAEVEFKNSIEIDPSRSELFDSYAFFLAQQGRTEEAITQIIKSRQIDPKYHLSQSMHRDLLIELSQKLYRDGEKEKALFELQKAIKFGRLHQQDQGFRKSQLLYQGILQKIQEEKSNSKSSNSK